MTVFLTNDDNNDELKSDGFLGISPCPDEEFNDYSFFYQLEKELKSAGIDQIESLTWDVNSTSLFKEANNTAGSLFVNLDLDYANASNYNVTTEEDIDVTK